MSRLIALVLVLTTPAVAAAQFDLTVLGGGVAITGHAQGEDAAHTGTVHPQGGFEPTVAFGYQHDRWRGGLILTRRSPGLILEDAEAGVTAPDAFRAVTIGAEIGHDLFRNGDAAVTGSVGITRTRWSFQTSNDVPRWRWGAMAALEGALPLAQHFAMITRVSAARTSSLFDDGELPDGFEPAAGNRYGVSVGLRVK